MIKTNIAVVTLISTDDQEMVQETLILLLKVSLKNLAALKDKIDRMNYFKGTPIEEALKRYDK